MEITVVGVIYLFLSREVFIVYASKLRKLGPVRWYPQPSIAGHDLKYAFSLTDFGNMISMNCSI